MMKKSPPKNGILSIRLAPEHRERLSTLASSLGLTPSEFARKVISDRIDGTEAQSLKRELARIANELPLLRREIAVVLGEFMIRQGGSPQETVDYLNRRLLKGLRPLEVNR